jgi:enolase-phosphatase E1
VTFELADRGIRTVVLDIEGTTTPIEFVYDALFPFARRSFPSYIREHLDMPGLHEPLARLREEWMEDVSRGESPPRWQDDDREERISGIAAYATWLMDRDRKSPPLKTLQGEIWARAYEDGTLRGEVFPDVPAALARWRAGGIDVAIYSSGSVLAQQMLFRTTAQGDLTAYISAFFDTSVGPKVAPESYRRIAATLDCAPESLLFISDTPAELRAARTAEWEVLLCRRQRHPPLSDDELTAISNFSEVG